MDNKMFRDSRRVLSLLSSICGQHGIRFDVTPTQCYITDALMIMYYPIPIMNILKSSAGKTKNFQQKHADIEYWIPMIMNMQKGTNLQHAIRPDRTIPNWDDNPIIQIPINRYNYITKFILTDYGYDEMIMLHRIVNTVDDKIIEYACGVGRQNNVHEIRYINVIIEKELAKDRLRQQKLQELDNRINQSDNLLREQIHEHSVLDMAQVEYSWKRMQENNELEKMFNNLTNGMR